MKGKRRHPISLIPFSSLYLFQTTRRDGTPSKSDRYTMEAAKTAIPPTTTGSPPPAQYIYKRLTVPGQIRTLVLHSTTSRIECSICNAPHQSGGYQALSYVWGSEERPFKAVTIDSDGKEQGHIPLTKNLRDALCDLRDTKELESKIFWIDQICINQKDRNEKSAQVAMMGEIYQNADRVITYLGAAVDSPQEERGLSLLKRLDAYYQDDIITLHSCESSHEASQKVSLGEIKGLPQKLAELGIDIDQEKASGHDWIWLYDMCFGEWTQRLWMVQEQLLNRNTIMLRGPHVLSWESVAGIVSLASTLVLPQGPYAAFWRRKGRDRLPDGFADAVFFLSTTRFHIVKGNCRFKYSLRATMSRLRALQCRDPRDRVYALMSICSDMGKLGIVPDYSQSNTALRFSLKLTQRLIEAEMNLHILTDVCTRHPPNATSTLPSWALSLTRSDDFWPPSTFDETFRSHPQICLSTNPRFDMDSATPTIIVKGRILDSVSIPSMMLAHNVAEEDDASMLIKFMASVSNLLLQTDASIDRVFRLSRTLLMHDYRSASESTFVTAENAAYYMWCFYQCSILIPEVPEPILDKCAELITRLGALCPSVRDRSTGLERSDAEAGLFFADRVSWRGRSLCCTNAERICNTMHNTEQGDLIATFQGANRLYVLRPVGEKYRLIGDAYVDGLMYGEAYEGINYEEVDYDIEII